MRPDIVRFVSVLSQRPRSAPPVPMSFPSSGRWLLNGLRQTFMISGTSILQSSNAGIHIANDSAGGAPYTGYLSDVRIQAAAVYSTNFTPPTTLAADAATIALYHLDEVSGSVAADASSHANDAALQNGAIFASPPSCRP